MSSVSLLDTITDISVTQDTDKTQFTLTKSSGSTVIESNNRIGPRGYEGSSGDNGPKGDKGVDASLLIGTLSWVIAGDGTLTPSSKYLLADGSEVLKSEYPLLFELFGNRFGTASDPGTLFVLPDLRENKLKKDVGGEVVDISINPLILAK